MSTAQNPYRATPNVAAVKRVTVMPVLILGGVLLVAVGTLVWFRGNGTSGATQEDVFAASRNKPALESAQMILAGAPRGGIPSEPDHAFVSSASAATAGGAWSESSYPTVPEVRAQAKAKALREDDLDSRSLSASSVVAIPNVNAVRARNASSVVPLPPGTTPSMAPRPTTLDALSALSPKENDPNLQEAKRQFLAEKENDSFVLSHSVVSPRERELKTGSLIPATLMTGINSDLPGSITAQVASHVYDTATGDAVLIPQGSRLFGRYDSQVAYGQSRVLAAWKRIVFPDGRSLNLDVMAGADAAGRGGFADEVDRHYGRIFGSALLMSVLGAGVQLSQPQARAFDNISSQQMIAANIGLQMGQTGMEVTRKNLNVQPTIKIRPGYRFAVIVNKDFVVSEDEES